MMGDGFYFSDEEISGVVIAAGGYGGILEQGQHSGIFGEEMASRYRWGREYILAKDLAAFGFEAAWDGDVLSLKYGTEKQGISGNKAFPPIKNDKEPTVKLNGLMIDYKIIQGDIALCIDDFCDLEKIPAGEHSRPDEYYSAFRQLGYSAYFFRKNADGSISFLPLENSVACNMGNITFAGIYGDATKAEMEEYCDLEAVLRKMGAAYTLQNNRLEISGADFREISLSLPSQATNYSALGYPVLRSEIVSPGSQKIPAYIVKGRMKVRTEEFCEAFGYHYSKESREGKPEKVIIENIR